MNINLQNYEDYFVRYIEHDLSADELIEVNRFLKVNPELKSELEAFEMTVIYPDERIGFPDKKLLYKVRMPGILAYRKQLTVFAVAACAATLLIIAFGRNEFTSLFSNEQAPSSIAQLNSHASAAGTADLSVAFPHYRNSMSYRLFNQAAASEPENTEVRNKIPATQPQNNERENLDAEIMAQLSKASGQPEQLFSEDHRDPEANNFSRNNMLMDPSAVQPSSSNNISVLTSYGNTPEDMTAPGTRSSQQMQQLANKINQQINEIGNAASTRDAKAVQQQNQSHPVHVSIQTKNIKFNHTFNAKSNSLIGNELLKIIQNDKPHK